MTDLERYRPMAYAIAREYFIPGADRDDVRQEAMIGLWKGLRDYEPGRGKLKSFIALCIRRQLATALKTALREKHEPLTRAARKSTDDEGVVVEILDLLPDPRADVVATLAGREELKRIAGVVRDELTPLERRALIGFANGQSYREIGEPKMVDNAIARARLKVAALNTAEARVRELEGALRRIAEKQQYALGIIETNGFIFDDIGSEPGNWKHLAFTLYNEICEVDIWARNALGVDIGEVLATTTETPADPWPTLPKEC